MAMILMKIPDIYDLVGKLVCDEVRAARQVLEIDKYVLRFVDIAPM